MARRNEDATIELVCIGGLGDCEDNPPTWMVDGRFNANGDFEPNDGDDTFCPECGEEGEPTDPDTSMVDFV